MTTTRAGFGWTPKPFVTDYEPRADGSLLLRPREAIAPYPLRTMDELERWARIAPERVLVARRGVDGHWIEVTYGAALQRVQRIAAGLMTRRLSPERPIVILSGNSIEHLLLAFAATWAGIPYSPVSPAYAQVAGDMEKLRFVFELLTPGLVAAFDTPKFERAIRDVVPGDVEIIGDVSQLGARHITPLRDLEAEPSPALEAAHARTGPDSIVKFLLTSGSTGQPKAVICHERMLCANSVMTREAMPFVSHQPPLLVDWLPWNHTFGGNHNIGLVLFNGGSLYIDDGKPTPHGFAETLRNLRELSPTVYFNVPKGFEMLAPQLQADAALRRTFYRDLSACFFAGAGLSQHTWNQLDAAANEERGVAIPVLSGLGATETGPSVTFTTPAMGRAGVIGLPAAGALVKLAPVEDKLEIRAYGPSITPGYWRRPDLTAAAFDDEGFYRMGDAVKLLDPNDPAKGLIFDGRIAEDFKLGSGTWVSVGPLRASLIAALAPFSQDVVIAGLNRDYLAAIVIPDINACTKFLLLNSPPTWNELATNEALLLAIRERLQAHAKQHSASSTHVKRAVLLPSSPSLDQGEITDKGSINQRAVLACRSALVAALYAEPVSEVVAVV